MQGIDKRALLRLPGNAAGPENPEAFLRSTAISPMHQREYRQVDETRIERIEPTVNEKAA